MQPLVSILIPCYNAEPWLAETLESALAQTWQNLEIIVVDDGSSDRSLEIARRYESRGVKVFSQKNQGACAARNAAFRKSSGDYIQYLDADDLLTADKIEIQMAVLAENPNCVAACQWGIFYQDPSQAEFVPVPLWTDRDPVDWVTTAWENNWMMNPGVWLFPRAVAKAAGPWNESLPSNPDDDGEYFCRILLASSGIRFCQKAKAYYRTGISGSLSKQSSDRSKVSRFYSLEFCMKHLLAVENSPRTRKACANRFQRFFYEVYPSVPNICEQAERRVAQLGGSDVQPVIGAKLKPLCALLGWRKAKKVQQFVYELAQKRNSNASSQPSVARQPISTRAKTEEALS
ncbi:glycosyltransferase family 2 protein [Oscillatoria sp. FACHB-1406]|uniref:glycosyltransferase family 2 protein n=1 Tax=Oscillatoria sp. FACHB-1406 TaxID=2692846 RepID=UPI00168A1A29|nr:glycosyltransferase family 2 protein [Oscillatoria sp. FACHB-1406]MBD2577331.1 glycosyltransferase family 2 protein [Oscillatoria sp. FACHB-1406]